MTNTDKLKRLAEAAMEFGCEYVGFDPAAILARIDGGRNDGPIQARS